jgi:hypothetical protein
MVLWWLLKWGILIVYRPIDSNNFHWVNSLVKNLLMEKKKKNHKMFVFAQDMGIWNWVKILLASTSLSPFTTAKKTWNKLFVIFFLKYIVNLNTYLWKKRMPKPNHYYPKYGIWRLGQGNSSDHSLAPPTVRICVR